MHSPQIPGIDGPELVRWFARALPELGEPLAASVFVGGRSNLTYRIQLPASTVVLRRPPLAATLHTAHDMHREYTVLARLAGGLVPVPRPLAFCADPDVIGAPFFVMEYVAGRVLRDTAAVAELSPQANALLSSSLADALAGVHRTDPRAAGLADFGRPEGFMQRQLLRWGRQWTSGSPTLTDGGRTTAAGERLVVRLAARLPRGGVAALLHGDFRLDNIVVSRDPVPRITAILDWEMSTLGDPLADLGLALVHWCLVEELRRAGLPLPAPPSAAPGFLTGRQFAESYAAGTGFDLSHLDEYLAFGCFKLAAILLGERARTAHTDPDTLSGARATAVIAALIEQAHQILDTGCGPWFSGGGHSPNSLSLTGSGSVRHGLS